MKMWWKIIFGLVIIYQIDFSLQKPDTNYDRLKFEATDEDLDKLYEKFKKHFNKTYDDEVRHKLCRESFKNRHTIIKRHNEQFSSGEETWKMGYNRFSDLPEDDYNKVFGYIPYTEDDNTHVKIDENVEDNGDINIDITETFEVDDKNLKKLKEELDDDYDPKGNKLSNVDESTQTKESNSEKIGNIKKFKEDPGDDYDLKKNQLKSDKNKPKKKSFWNRTGIFKIFQKEQDDDYYPKKNRLNADENKQKKNSLWNRFGNLKIFKKHPDDDDDSKKNQSNNKTKKKTFWKTVLDHHFGWVFRLFGKNENRRTKRSLFDTDRLKSDTHKINKRQDNVFQKFKSPAEIDQENCIKKCNSSSNGLKSDAPKINKRQDNVFQKFKSPAEIDQENCIQKCTPSSDGLKSDTHKINKRQDNVFQKFKSPAEIDQENCIKKCNSSSNGLKSDAHKINKRQDNVFQKFKSPAEIDQENCIKKCTTSSDGLKSDTHKINKRQDNVFQKFKSPAEIDQENCIEKCKPSSNGLKSDAHKINKRQDNVFQKFKPPAEIDQEHCIKKCKPSSDGLKSDTHKINKRQDNVFQKFKSPAEIDQENCIKKCNSSSNGLKSDAHKINKRQDNVFQKFKSPAEIDQENCIKKCTTSSDGLKSDTHKINKRQDNVFQKFKSPAEIDQENCIEKCKPSSNGLKSDAHKINKRQDNVFQKFKPPAEIDQEHCIKKCKPSSDGLKSDTHKINKRQVDVFQISSEFENKTNKSRKLSRKLFNIFKKNDIKEINKITPLNERFEEESILDLIDGDPPENNKGHLENPPSRRERAIRIPDSKDWRKDGAVTKVIDQGGCAGCWSFSVIAALESHYYLKHKKLYKFSSQQILDCAKGDDSKGCNQGSMYAAFKYLESNGTTSESRYPFKAKDGQCSDEKVTKSVKIKKHYRLSSEEEILEVVGTIGPVAVGLDARQLQLYDSGIYQKQDCGTTVREMNHAVLIVGYGTRHGADYWICKNSWGSGWGERGYFKMARGKNMCGIAVLGRYPEIL